MSFQKAIGNFQGAVLLASQKNDAVLGAIAQGLEHLTHALAAALPNPPAAGAAAQPNLPAAGAAAPTGGVTKP